MISVHIVSDDESIMLPCKRNAVGVVIILRGRANEDASGYLLKKVRIKYSYAIV